MIDSVTIENFKAFKEETLVLGNHTLFIGTNKSGKTTFLEALDAFFNHRIELQDVRNKQRPVVVECLIDEKRYKKVFTPPHYHFNVNASKGDFEDLLAIQYLYLPKKPVSLEHFFNQCFALHYKAQNETNANGIFKDLSFFETTPRLIHKNLSFAFDLRFRNIHSEQDRKQFRAHLLKTSTANRKVYLGIDEIEHSLPFSHYRTIVDQSEQTFIVSKQKRFINDFPYTFHPLYKTNIQKEFRTVTGPLHKTKKKPFLLVEGKYDVPWFESALVHLGKFEDYRVLPCGGTGNIQFVERQLKKADYKTIAVTDGDSDVSDFRLKREIIELYADYGFVNVKFRTDFTRQPKTKRELFKAINAHEDEVKNVLASYPTHHLYKSHPFVQEVSSILKRAEKER